MTSSHSLDCPSSPQDKVRVRHGAWIKASQAVANCREPDGHGRRELQLIERASRLLLDLAVDHLVESMPGYDGRHQSRPVSHAPSHH
jgi:hypothetical protein